MEQLLIKFEHLKNKHPLKAMHLIKTAIATEPNNFGYLVALGTYLCKNDADKEGIKYLNRAQKISELDPNTTFVMALAQMRNEQYYLAIRNFKAVSNLYPEAYYNASICFISLSEYEKALAEARNLVNHNYLGKEALMLIIDIYSFLNNTEMIKIEAENYKKKYQADSYYHYLMGDESFKKEKYIESAYHFSKITRGEMERRSYNSKYAYSLLKINHFNKALDVYEDILANSNYHESDIIEYSEVLFHLERYQDVLDVIEKYDAKILNKNELKRMRAKAYYKLHLE